MSTIVPPTVPPTALTPTPIGYEPTTCAPWCIDTTGHRPSTADPAEQRCRSTVHRIDTPLGGGHGTNQIATTSAGISLQAEQAPGEPPAYVLGIEIGGTEYWARLGAADLRVLITAARTLLAWTAT